MVIIKQYVNLDPDKPEQLDGLDKARAGTSVVFEATIDPGQLPPAPAPLDEWP